MGKSTYRHLEGNRTLRMNEFTIAIAGSGNVASHLAKSIAEVESLRLVAVASRKKENASELVNSIGVEECDACYYSEIAAKKPDVIIVSVSDRAINNVVEAIGRLEYRPLILHTSGTVNKSQLSPISDRTGILYPFQTFTKGFATDMSKVPFFVETSQADDLDIVRHIAEMIGGKVYDSDENRRRHLHIAGVFTSNFVNVLLGAVEKQLARAGYPSEVAEPLLEQTIAKAHEIGSFKAQTGPAVRGDKAVMASQLADVDPEYAEAYKVLSELIMKIHSRHE